MYKPLAVLTCFLLLLACHGPDAISEGADPTGSSALGLRVRHMGRPIAARPAKVWTGRIDDVTAAQRGGGVCGGGRVEIVPVVRHPRLGSCAAHALRDLVRVNWHCEGEECDPDGCHEAADPVVRAAIRINRNARHADTVVNNVTEEVSAVKLQANSIAHHFFNPLHKAFVRRVGRLATLPRGDEQRRLPIRTRVAVIDDLSGNVLFARPGAVDQNIGQHGRAVALAINTLACPAPNNRNSVCTNQMTFHRAMDPNTATGTLLDLAVAICDAVDAWQYERAAPPNLVLNLSLGYDPPESNELGVGDEAVRAAIDYAVCAGALVIAAAGNDGPGREGSGPLAPAAWESEPAPSEGECEAIGFERTTPDDYDPLVFAVGGVNGEGRPMDFSRTGGQPRLVAYADHVVSPDQVSGPAGPSQMATNDRPARLMNARAAALDARGASRDVVLGAGGDPGLRRTSETLTGTSMSTAVVSGIAAALWTYAPEATGAEIMQWIHDSGQPVPGGNRSDEAPEADFCLATGTPADAVADDPGDPAVAGERGCPPIREASLCLALAQLVAGEDLPCREAHGAAEEPADTDTGLRAAAEAALQDMRDDMNDEAGSGEMADDPTPDAGTATEPPAPVSSQPGVPGCDVCWLWRPPGGNHQLVVSLNKFLPGHIENIRAQPLDKLGNPSWVAASIDNPYLTLSGSDYAIVGVPTYVAGIGARIVYDHDREDGSPLEHDAHEDIFYFH